MVFLKRVTIHHKPKRRIVKEMSLYGKPAHGNAMTPNVIPIAAKKEMTQGVHPYVKIPKRMLTNERLLALLSLPIKLNCALENVSMMVLISAMTTLTNIFKTTSHTEYEFAIKA